MGLDGRHPDLVGGFNRLDSTIIKAGSGRVIAKEGADGLLGLAVEHPDYPDGLGIVIKIAHGWDPQAHLVRRSVVLGVLGFELRNPYVLHRQKPFVVADVIPPALRDRIGAVDPWDDGIRMWTAGFSTPMSSSTAPSESAAARRREHRPVPELRNFIGGEFRPAKNGQWLDDRNRPPARSSPVFRTATPPTSTMRWPPLARLPRLRRHVGRSRSALLAEMAARIEAHAGDLAELEAMDVGKPIALARRLDIPRAIANFRFFAGAILHTATKCHPMDGAALNYTLRRPLGVVGLIRPWNLPLYLLTWKVAPALATGNTLVAKPSELSPITANRLAEIAIEAGMPPGVLNIVHGRGTQAGAALASIPMCARSPSPAARHRGGDHAAAAARCSKRCRSSSAAKTRASSSPMPTSMRRSRGPRGRRS